MARALPGTKYFDLEQPGERVRLDLEWETLIRGRRLAVLDEAQNMPEVFPRMRGAIDAAPSRAGRFLVLGSVSPHLLRQVSESLAGRVSFLELTPFLVSELEAQSPDLPWLRGGFPRGGILRPSNFPQWERDYLTAVAFRDLPLLGLDAQPQLVERLFRMAAAWQGQVFNASELGRALGISYHTVQRYVDYLEGVFLLRRLPPFHTNLGKRLVKSPKLYWRDSGLLHALLGIRNRRDLLGHPLAGASWEGFILEQILGHCQAWGREAEAYFFRTSDGHEIDLLLRLENRLLALEVKLTASPAPEDSRRLQKTSEWVKADYSVLLCRPPKSVFGESMAVCGLRDFLRWLHPRPTPRKAR